MAAKQKGISVTYILIIAVLVVAIAGFTVFYKPPSPSSPPSTNQGEIKKFASEADLVAYLNNSVSQQYNGGYFGGFAGAPAPMMRGATAEQLTVAGAAGPDVAKAGGGTSSDYSTTNVQIAGVDESDFVKNDGKYIYTVTNGYVVITDAYPADSAKIVSIINLTKDNPQQIYINGDKLVVFGNVYDYYPGPMPVDIGGGIATTPAEAVAAPAAPAAEPAVAAKIAAMPIRYGGQTSYIKVYDVSDRSNPVLSNNLVFNGTYQDSRMIGDYVYVIFNAPAYNYASGIPGFMPYQRSFPDVYYFDAPDYSYQFTNVISLNVKSAEIKNKVFLTGYSTNLFVSQNNIYMVYQKQIDRRDLFNRMLDGVILPEVPESVATEIKTIRDSDKSDFRKQAEIQIVLEDWIQQIGPEEAAKFQQRMADRYSQMASDIAKEFDKSTVHKISINNGGIEYKTSGDVPGHPLNQFSMDENNGYFRIATTTQGIQGGSTLNHIYVMDGGMKIVGRAEDLAKGETIYSARFIGNRAYLVTFKTVDPLFVVDLSDPTNPKVLGQLKIPGYSDYLHPYDETHLIGIGKDVDESIDAGKVHQTGAVYYTAIKGVKMSLFDVADVSNPKEVAKIVIGDRGTDSEALRDHKAFLFNKEKNLLVIPIMLVENVSTDYYGQPSWQGAYVFSITPETGFVLRGRVTHANQIDKEKQYYYYYGPYSVTRSLYMDDTLYTISGSAIKANNLNDLSEIKKIDLPVQVFHPIIY